MRAVTLPAAAKLVPAWNGVFDELVCMSVLSVYVYTTDLHQFFVLVAYDRGSVLLWRRSLLPVLWMTSCLRGGMPNDVIASSCAG